MLKLENNTPKQIAVIYTRVSGAKQVRDGDGLASQETRCREYAAYKNYEVIGVFKDDMSGKFTKRPAMDEMLAFLRKHRLHDPIVIIDDISRLARGLDAHLKLRQLLSSAGGKLESPSIEFGDDPDSIMVENLLATVAQHQREKNGQQTMNRMRGRMMNGYWVFNNPIGYKYEKVSGHGKMLVPDEAKASAIKEGLEGYASGRFQTLTELKRFFETTDVFPKNKHGEIHPTRIQEMIERVIYAGYISYEPWGLNMIEGKHQGIIPLETWEAIQCRRTSLAKAAARKDLSADFPLRGFVTCGDCNQPYTSCWSKGRSSKYPYYLCDTKGCVSYRKSVRKEKIEGEFESLLKTLQPTRELFAMSLAMFQEIWDTRLASINDSKKTININIKKLDRKLTQFLDRIVDTDNASVIAAYENRIAEIERQKAKLSENLTKSNEPASSFEEIYRTAFSFLANPWKLWVSDRLEDRRAVLKLVFAERLPYHRNEGYRTAKTSLPFKALEDIHMGKSEMVPPAGV